MNKSHARRLKPGLIIGHLFLVLIFISFSGAIYAQKSSDTAQTKIGTPKEGSGGWPTTGTVTQGPEGSAGHAANNLEALDISSSLGTPIYATFDGVAFGYDCDNRGECNNSYGDLGNYVKIIPDSNPSAVVLYGHMLSVTIAGETRVRMGQQLGLMGYSGYVIPSGPGGTHLHYEFRGIRLVAPYVPIEISPRTCGQGTCNPSGVSSN